MTREDFSKMRFRSGMRAYYNDKSYPIFTVDFEEDLIGLDYYNDEEDSIRWVRCESINILEEPCV